MQLMYNEVKCTIWLFCKVFGLAILYLPTFLFPHPPSPPAIKTFPVMKFALRSMSPTAEICSPVALKWSKTLAYYIIKYIIIMSIAIRLLTISSRNLNLASTNLVSFGGWHDFITSQNELIGTSTFFRERKNNSQSITFKTYNHKICKQIFTVYLLECSRHLSIQIKASASESYSCLQKWWWNWTRTIMLNRQFCFKK